MKSLYLRLNDNYNTINHSVSSEDIQVKREILSADVSVNGSQNTLLQRTAS